jgi:hypothetical protein
LTAIIFELEVSLAYVELPFWLSPNVCLMLPRDTENVSSAYYLGFFSAVLLKMQGRRHSRSNKQVIVYFKKKNSNPVF